MTNLSNVKHVSEDQLEQYVLRRLPEREVDEVEEHLLVCAPCQDSLQETEEFLAAMKVATAELLSRPKPQSVWANWLRSVFAIPKPVFAAVACALFAFVLLVPRNTRTATLEMESLRGPEAATQAPSNAQLTLRLSLAGLASAAGPFEVQVADVGGEIVSKTGARVEGLRAVARVDGLGAGTYWVRLHEKGELVREFGLNVR